VRRGPRLELVSRAVMIGARGGRCAAVIVALAPLLVLPVAHDASAASGQVARFAIVIGNNGAETAAVPSLRYADDDAVATHELLVEAGVESRLLARLDADSQRLHPGLATAGPPSGQALDHALSDLSERMRARAAQGDTVEFLFFYSGHGDVDQGEGYVVLEDRRFTRTMLYALLAHSPATRNHVVIDSCKSFFLAFDKGPGGKREPYARSFVSDAVPARQNNTGFILSTSSGRDSHEWERYQAGILSHEVRSGLRGAADVDRDGRVTYAELGAFLWAANEAIINPKYRPDFTIRPPSQDLKQELIRWSPERRTTALRLEGKRMGHVYVETANGQRMLDAHPAPDQALLLYVPPDRPLFVRRSDEMAEWVVTEHSPPTITMLLPARPEVALRGALHLAFEQFFALAFNGDTVRAYEHRFQQSELAVVPASLEPASDRGYMVRVVAASAAAATAAAGIVLGALALQQYESGARRSQVEVPSVNRTVMRLDVASIACTMAGAVSLTWIWRQWPASTAPTIEAISAQGVALGVRGFY
jgi:hypothetical protein